MKFITSALLICFLLCLQGFRAQNGLEGIIVEKYYISDANDTAGRRISGFLPPGSVTYRIFVDMLPGYLFHAAYGAADHELKIETTTTFFNNEYIGQNVPNTIPYRTLKRNTVMLDSWLSVGGAAEGHYGVLKEEDDSLETIVHEKQFLQGANKLAGIPVKERDGLRYGATIPFPVFFRIDTIVNVFHGLPGSRFATRDGAWVCLGGTPGPDSLGTNRVLIAQITTNGDLSFELNVQVGKRGDTADKYEKYVARNPVGKEILLSSLIYNSKETKLSSAKEKKPAKTK